MLGIRDGETGMGEEKGCELKRNQMMESNTSNIVNFQLPGCVGQEKLRVTAPLSSMEVIHGLWMISASARNRWSAEIVAGHGA